MSACWWSGLSTHLVLDGHDRLHASLLEDVMPEVVTIREVRPKEALDVCIQNMYSYDYI